MGTQGRAMWRAELPYCTTSETACILQSVWIKGNAELPFTTYGMNHIKLLIFKHCDIIKIKMGMCPLELSHLESLHEEKGRIRDFVGSVLSPMSHGRWGGVIVVKKWGRHSQRWWQTSGNRGFQSLLRNERFTISERRDWDKVRRT